MWGTDFAEFRYLAGLLALVLVCSFVILAFYISTVDILDLGN